MEIEKRIQELQVLIDSGITPEVYEIFNDIKSDAATNGCSKVIDDFIEVNISKLSSDIEEIYELTKRLSKI